MELRLYISTFPPIFQTKRKKKLLHRPFTAFNCISHQSGSIDGKWNPFPYFPKIESKRKRGEKALCVRAISFNDNFNGAFLYICGWCVCNMNVHLTAKVIKNKTAKIH